MKTPTSLTVTKSLCWRSERRGETLGAVSHQRKPPETTKV